MSIRKIDKSNYVIGTTVASKKGASLLVERVQLTQAGFSALTTTAESIGGQQGLIACVPITEWRWNNDEGTWVGLTDEEKNQVAWSCGAMSADWLEFAEAIEAKLRSKNENSN